MIKSTCNSLIGWRYNAAGLVTRMIYPGGRQGQIGEVMNYSYLSQMSLNRLYSQDYGYYYLQSSRYDAAGRALYRGYGATSLAVNPLLQSSSTYYGWSSQGGRLRYLSLGSYADPTSLEYLEYDYDNVGNIEWIKDWKMGNPQTLFFAYDTLNRLTTAQASGGTNGNGDYAQETYSYDATTGNLAYKSTLGSYTYSTYHPHAVASISNGWSFQYDANGNQTQRITGSTFNLSYNADGKMVEVSGAATDSFVYDGDGNRVKSIVGSTTTVFIGNYYEWEANTSRKHYYAGMQRIAMRDGETLYYLFGEHLGSTSLSYRVSDGYVARHLYKPWGEKRYPAGASELPTKYRFTGQYVQNELWLYYYNARWYDNRVGRFIQADTVIPI